MVKTEVSPKFSLKGWDFKKWIKGNKDVIKIIIGAVVAISVANPELLPVNLTIGVGAIGVKAILDIVDYFSTEVSN